MTRLEVLAQLTGSGLPYELVEIEALGRRVRAFKNAPVNLRELFEAGRSDLPFIVYEDERLTFEQAWAQLSVYFDGCAYDGLSEVGCRCLRVG